MSENLNAKCFSSLIFDICSEIKKSATFSALNSCQNIVPVDHRCRRCEIVIFINVDSYRRIFIVVNKCRNSNVAVKLTFLYIDKCRKCSFLMLPILIRLLLRLLSVAEVDSCYQRNKCKNLVRNYCIFFSRLNSRRTKLRVKYELK